MSLNSQSFPALRCGTLLYLFQAALILPSPIFLFYLGQGGCKLEAELGLVHHILGTSASSTSILF